MCMFVLRSRSGCGFAASMCFETQDDGTAEFEDTLLLDRATELGRLLFTQDKDLLREATRRQRAGERFSGIVYAHQLEIRVGECVNNLEIIAKGSEPEEWICRVEHLPL